MPPLRLARSRVIARVNVGEIIAAYSGLRTGHGCLASACGSLAKPGLSGKFPERRGANTWLT